MNEISRSNRIKNVLSLEMAREHARQPRGSPNGHVSKRSNQRPLQRLEAENAQLRECVADLMLQIRALRDGGREISPATLHATDCSDPGSEHCDADSLSRQSAKLG